MRDLAARALDAARSAGADYADVRVVRTRTQSLTTKNEQVGSLDERDDEGFGVRVLAGGAWGFASRAGDAPEAAVAAAQEAVVLARAAARGCRSPVEMAPAKALQASYRTPFEIDPFSISLDAKLDFLFAIDRALRAEKAVRVARSSMDFAKKQQFFASTEGARIDQEILSSGAGYVATAVGDGEIQVRSYPNSFRGQFETRGYEMLADWRLLENAPRVASEAAALLVADPCPPGARDVILGGSQLGLQIHESCGHPAELDRVLGSEANYAGQSFLTPDLQGELCYGSPLVTLRADATSPRGMGTFGYDDEGVAAQSWDLVRDGRFVDYLTSRETARRIGASASRGCMRADGWRNFPLIRMVNVWLVPGTWGFEDLVADTDDGILMETNRSWSIDSYRLNFQFGTEIGWEIRHGKRGRMLRNPTYQGTTTDFWNRCDAICDARHWVLWGIPSCGKGQPGQIMATGHGAAPARFRKIQVGVARAGS